MKLAETCVFSRHQSSGKLRSPPLLLFQKYNPGVNWILGLLFCYSSYSFIFLWYAAYAVDSFRSPLHALLFLCSLQIGCLIH